MGYYAHEQGFLKEVENYANYHSLIDAEYDLVKVKYLENIC